MPTTYAIPNGRTVMDATTYTGTGSSLAVTNTTGFQPDFVWVKSRSNAQDHIVVNSVVGANKNLYSNRTTAEVTNNSGGYVSTLNSNGFTVVPGATNADDTVRSGWTYVGWQWQAGQGSTSSNTSGSITSTVSANTTAGFSIVTFTAQSSGSGTVGHGLSAAPQFIITKSRTQTYSWATYHVSLGNTKYLTLNTTNATTTNAIWNNTSPTSTVFSLGSDFAGNDSCVAYCWTPIAGFSQFGSYTGNNSTDGPFIYTGFRPKWVMVKNSDTAATSWVVLDSSRNTYNVANSILLPNDQGAEDSSSNRMDFLSNGFKLRLAGNWGNNSGSTYIYAAFAENPFKYANAR